MRGTAGGAFDAAGFLARERERIEAVLSGLVDELLAGSPASIAEPIRYAVESGGKRLRPILCVAAYRAVRGGGEGEEPGGIRTVACAIELIHTYSLMHDDLPCMDDDDLRRGRPTAHRVFGEERTMVAAAALIPLAALAAERGGRALGLRPDERMALVGELCAAAGGGGMVGGQVLDLAAEGRAVALEELEAIHRAKTGALLAASLRLGGLAARASGEALEALGAYGRCIGLAFQIADDILDVTGRTAVIGKTAGRDQALAKATFPALLGLDAARERAEAEADAAIDALRRAGIATPELEALARFSIERDR